MPKVIKQTTDTTYKVSTRPLYDLSPEQVTLLEENDNTPAFAGVYGNFRGGVTKAIGHCSERYGLVQNNTLTDAVEEALESNGVSDFSKSANVIGNGERVYVNYDLKGDGFSKSVGKGKRRVGDELGMRLTVKNSFDRSLRLSVVLGFLRLVCTNGMVSLSKEFDLTRRHQQGVDTSFLSEGIQMALGLADDQAKVFDRLADKEIKQEQGTSILANLERKKLITSSNMKDSIEAVWNDPNYGEDNGRNLYNLYNATTQHLTRVVEPKRYELAQKVNTNVLRALNKMTLDKSEFDKYLLPIKTENN